MKFKQTKISFLLMFLLAIPSGVFADFSVSPISYSNQKLGNNPSEVNIKVVTVQQTTAISAVNKTGQTNTRTSCLAESQQTANNLVQDASAFNLNQPANCFALQVGKSTVTFSRLNVLPLAVSVPKIVVVYNRSVVSAANFAALPASQNIPILPLATVLFLINGALWKRRIWGNKPLVVGKILKPALTLHQLQMLRC